MYTCSFQGECCIELQGNVVLNLIEVNHGFASFELVGFRRPFITIIDFRETTINDAREVESMSDLSDFAYDINQPAHTRVSLDEQGNIIIELQGPSGAEPQYMLWAAIGISNTVPAYDYQLFRVDNLPNGEFAFWSIYKRPPSYELIPTEEVHDLVLRG